MAHRSLSIPRIVTLVALIGCFATMAACTSSPRYRKGPSGGTEVTIGDETVDLRGKDVVEKAETFMGTPYRYGGVSEKGVDCSGLVYAVYRDFGIALPRSSQAQAGFGTAIGQSELSAGDLVFFRTGRGSAITHVGIYAGKGQFIHASTQWKRVKYDRLDNKYFRSRYVTARRVL